MTVYYNEYDKKAAAWLRELIELGLIAKGIVDDRSIADVSPNDLKGFKQHHFFAGIGGWSYALRLAGWPDDRPVWTGSCPCQPFSSAGLGKGVDDDRHLWPAFRWLLAQCRPTAIVGEQVASKAGRGWLFGVRDDLEAMGYAVGAADLCSPCVGSPHIRQRLYWMADSIISNTGGVQGSDNQKQSDCQHHNGNSVWDDNRDSGNLSGLADVQCEGQQGRLSRRTNSEREDFNGCTGCNSPINGWGDSRAIYCRDEKFRRIPVEPAFFPLAHGLSGRMAALKGFGNAIVPQLAAEFIKSSKGE